MFDPSTPIEIYHPSGKWKPVVFLIAVIGVVVGAISGAVYQWIVNINPLVYFNVLASFGAAWLVGMGAYLVIKASQCRNILIASALSFIFGLSAVIASHYVSYRHWLGLYYQAAEQEIKGNSNLPVIAPEVSQSLVKNFAPSFRELIKLRIEEGWSFKSVRQKNGSGIVINGALVPLIWLLEAAIFIVIAILIGMGSATEPFCEACDCWADHSLEIADYPITNSSTRMKIAQAANLSELFEKPESAQSFEGFNRGQTLLRYKLNICPACQKLAFLSISEERTFLDRRGDEKKKTTELWKNVILEDETIDPFLKIHRPEILDEPEEEGAPAPKDKRPDSVSSVLSHFK